MFGRVFGLVLLDLILVSHFPFSAGTCWPLGKRFMITTGGVSELVQTSVMLISVKSVMHHALQRELYTHMNLSLGRCFVSSLEG